MTPQWITPQWADLKLVKQRTTRLVSLGRRLPLKRGPVEGSAMRPCNARKFMFKFGFPPFAFKGTGSGPPLSCLLRIFSVVYTSSIPKEPEGQQVSEHLNIQVTDNNIKVFLKIKRTTILKKLMDAFCERQGIR
ncbi:hypothetical protein B0J14DRAFT_566999 [Halenospora varia]|nr:hypothetical protein B0J14DRAFT_566999 [Halenospora varia]